MDDGTIYCKACDMLLKDRQQYETHKQHLEHKKNSGEDEGEDEGIDLDGIDSIVKLLDSIENEEHAMMPAEEEGLPTIPEEEEETHIDFDPYIFDSIDMQIIAVAKCDRDFLTAFWAHPENQHELELVSSARLPPRFPTTLILSTVPS